MSVKEFDVTLPSGLSVYLQTEVTKLPITRKLKYWTGTRWKAPSPPQHVHVKVPGVLVSVVVSGLSLSARSCCKPPDAFSSKVGRLKAARRLLANPELKKVVAREDRKALLLAIVRNGRPWVGRSKGAVGGEAPYSQGK